MNRPENWRPIADWPYEISDMGRVFSPPRLVRSRWGTQYLQPGRILLPSGTRPHVKLSRDGEVTYPSVHVLVLEAFAGPRPPGMVACHGPGGPYDNRWPENLSWGTQSDNLTLDRYRDGTAVNGERVHGAVLTAGIVRECRRGYAAGGSFYDMAREQGVNPTTMWKAVTGRTWRHL